MTREEFKELVKNEQIFAPCVWDCNRKQSSECRNAGRSLPGAVDFRASTDHDRFAAGLCGGWNTDSFGTDLYCKPH